MSSHFNLSYQFKFLLLLAGCYFLMLRLNQMLYYALCLLNHSSTEAVLFACLLSDWATTTVRLLGPKVENSGKGKQVFFPRHSDVLPHREPNEDFATFQLLAQCLDQLSYAAALFSDVKRLLYLYI